MHKTMTAVLTAGLLIATPIARHIDIQLLDAGVIMGATNTPTPSEGYAEAAEQLYLEPNGYDGTNFSILTTPEGVHGGSYVAGAQDLVNDVNSIGNSDGEIYVFGYSQSSDFTTIAAQSTQDLPVHYVLVGDSANPNGGFLTDHGWLSEYHVADNEPGVYGDNPTDIYTLGYDKWADEPDYDYYRIAVTNAHDGGVLAHKMYLGLTPAEIQSATTITDGNVTYHDIPNQMLPVLADDLENGAKGDAEYDLHQPVDQVKVDLGYGHLDQIVNGQVVPNEFNTDPSDPGTEVRHIDHHLPPGVTKVELHQTLTEARAIGEANYHDALTVPGYEGAAYNAAVEGTHLVAAGVAAGDITPEQGASLDALIMSTWLPDGGSADTVSALAGSLDSSGVPFADSVADSLLHSGALFDPFPHIEAALQFLTGMF
jgi:PE-PPE domain